MASKRPSSFKPTAPPIKPKKQGTPVSKMTKVAGRRIGGALRAEQARQQKRRDSKR